MKTLEERAEEFMQEISEPHIIDINNCSHYSIQPIDMAGFHRQELDRKLDFLNQEKTSSRFMPNRSLEEILKDAAIDYVINKLNEL